LVGTQKKQVFLLRHGLKALHADLDPLGGACDNCLDGAQIREEYPFIDIMSVRNGVARHRVLSALFACIRHETLLMEIPDAKV
jgi:hypothetical protein